MSSDLLRYYERELTYLRKLGGEVVPSPDEPDVLRFRDRDGISVELKAV